MVEQKFFELFLIFFCFFIFALCVFSLALLISSRVFGFHNPTFKKSFRITAIVGAAWFLLWFVGVLLVSDNMFLAVYPALVAVLLFVKFNYLLKRAYGNSWLQSVGVFVTTGVIFAGIFFGVMFPIRTYFVEPFIVQGSSMSPAYNTGDYLLVDKYDKRFDRGDVVVFLATEPGYFYIQRIVGLPGETLEIQNGNVFINGQRLPELYVNARGMISRQVLNEKPRAVSENISVSLGTDEFYLLGDNRDNAKDSRILGPIKRASIGGKVFYKVGY